ncbi:hypothetical protein D3C73_1332170 [compost metagenome]
MGQQVVGHARRAAQANVTHQPIGKIAHLTLGFGDVQLQLPAPCQQQLADIGEFDAAAVALKQPGAQRLFKPLNALGQCRLAAVELFCGPAQVAEFGDGFEVGEIAQVHDS